MVFLIMAGLRLMIFVDLHPKPECIECKFDLVGGELPSYVCICMYLSTVYPSVYMGSCNSPNQGPILGPQ